MCCEFGRIVETTHTGDRTLYGTRSVVWLRRLCPVMSSLQAFAKFGAQHGLFTLGVVTAIGGLCYVCADVATRHIKLEAELEALRHRLEVDQEIFKSKLVIESERARGAGAVERAKRETADHFLQLGFTEE